jgi:uncharacterized protein (TIGR00730 family)
MQPNRGRFVNEDPWRIFRIMAEFVESFETLSQVGPAVTVFGSARTKPSNKDYKATVRLCKALAQNNFAVITGGGPGIMEAANKGAAEGGGLSVGLNIKLPHEQEGNPYANLPIDFHYFFSRKVCLAKYSTAFVYLPGGFGTMDEFFEILTLVQTRKIPRFPLVLYGKDYWRGLFRWINSTLKKGRYISPKDTELVTLTDDPDEAVEVIVDWHKRRNPQHTPPLAYL